jgi:hypothetical protein
MHAHIICDKLVLLEVSLVGTRKIILNENYMTLNGICVRVRFNM